MAIAWLPQKVRGVKAGLFLKAREEKLLQYQCQRQKMNTFTMSYGLFETNKKLQVGFLSISVYVVYISMFFLLVNFYVIKHIVIMLPARSIKHLELIPTCFASSTERI